MSLKRVCTYCHWNVPEEGHRRDCPYKDRRGFTHKARAPMKKDKRVTMPKVKIDWAYVDVKVGRKKLAKIIGEQNADKRHTVPVSIKGHFTAIASRDDGTSIEFEMTVTDVKLGKARRTKKEA